MKLQKITPIFLAVVLVTITITLETSVLVDDAFASNDKQINEKYMKIMKSTIILY
jgi:hypothetical protein